MKTTTHNLRNLFRTGILITGLALFSIGSAQPVYEIQSGDQVNQILISANPGGHRTKTKAQELTTNVKDVVSQMENDARYWVDFLKETVSREETDKSNMLTETERMQGDPAYWSNYLKDNVNTSEEEAPVIDNSMESDPYYWMNYLREVEKQSI